MFHKLYAVVLYTAILCLGISEASARSLQSVIDTYCRKDCITAQELADISAKIERSYKIDQRAVIAIVHVESKYHIRAKNGTSMGLSQVLLRYHKGKFRGRDYLDPEDNLFAGMKVFSDCLIKMKGNYSRAFGCYNGGGDKQYITKANKAYAMVKALIIPVSSDDQLKQFLIKKKLVSHS